MAIRHFNKMHWLLSISIRLSFQNLHRLPFGLKIQVKHRDNEKGDRAKVSQDELMQEAIKQGNISLNEGGIPIGAILVSQGKILGRGHNRRVQKGSAILHAEMDALEAAGRLSASDYRQSTLYTTLSPCAMCSGAILLYRIPHVVIGENHTFRGEEKLLRERGVLIEVLDNPTCKEMMRRFVIQHPALWEEDIGFD